MRAAACAAVLALALALPAAGGAQAADDAARPISLDEAVRLARRNAPLAVQARGQTRLGDAAVRAAYASFIPNVNVSLGNTRQGGDRIGPQGNLVPFTGRPWSYSSGVSANVDLFDGGRRLFEVRAAKADVGAAEANEVAQSFRVALDVSQQFYAALAARERAGAAQAQLDQAQQQFRASVARVAAGVATVSDSLRSVVLVGNARLALLTAENDLLVADAALSRLVGTPFTVTAAPGDTLVELRAVPDTSALFPLAERGPAVRQAEAALAAARADVRASRTSYFPTISANYSRGGSGFDPYYGQGPATYRCATGRDAANAPIIGDCTRYAYSDRFSLNFSLPLFNQFTRETGVTRARVAEDNAGATLRDARLQARQTLVQQTGALRTAQARAEIQRASVQAAEEDLRVVRRRYELGASTLVDVLTSQTQLDQARVALIQARYDARVARAQLEALVGRELR